MTIEFTLDELNEIYDLALDNNRKEIIAKIETKYTYCFGCHSLLLHEDYQHHYDVTCPVLNCPWNE